MNVSLGKKKKDCNLCDSNSNSNVYCISLKEKNMKEMTKSVEEDMSETQMETTSTSKKSDGYDKED